MIVKVLVCGNFGVSNKVINLKTKITIFMNSNLKNISLTLTEQMFEQNIPQR